MSRYQTFVFEDYEFDPDAKTLNLRYGYDDALRFTETYRFDFDFAPYDGTALDRACQQLFFMAGVSYYKMYLAPQIRVNAGQIDPQLGQLLETTYQKGLGEFWYVNRLDPRTPVTFPRSASPLPQVLARGSGLLVGIGGGKDSLVGVELLRGQPGLNIATWSLNHRPQLTPLIERVGLKHYWVEREWDPKIAELNKQDALNGHIPISAIIACAGTITAILSGRRDQVVSNEQSANEPTLTYQGVPINHQYSKGQEFEQNYQRFLAASYGDCLRYYSLLRPLSELRIAELFAARGWFDKYHDVFSSCNRAFVHGALSNSAHGGRIFWDGTCSKCAFVYLALTPFLPPEKIQALFHGKNLLLDPALEPTYRQLLGIEGDRPLDCVGDIKEARAAMREAQKTHPELAKYQFEIPDDYNFQFLSAHSMPPEIWELVRPQISAA